MSEPGRAYLCTGSVNCCFVDGEPCVFSVRDVAGRDYACGLMVKYGSWDLVNKSPEYGPVGDYWKSTGQEFNLCETSDPAFCCRPEFRQGRHNENCEPGCVEKVGV